MLSVTFADSLLAKRTPKLFFKTGSPVIVTFSTIQLSQSVKIIKYDTEKDTQNVEYIAGPFATPHDFGSETFTSQHKYTTFGGVITKKLPAVIDKITGEYIDKKSPGTLPNLTDVGFAGNYGSDIIFTENGIMIRGGKLISKNTKS